MKGAVATLAAEVQQTGIRMVDVMRRTSRAIDIGVTPTWFADEKNPPWAFKVPHVETNKRLGMAPGTWTVATGPRMLESERCRPGSRVTCPRGPNWCGRTHLLWVPMPRVTVDTVVEMVPAGELVRVVTGTGQGTILARPSDQDQWWEEYPPAPDSTVIPEQQGSGDGRVRHRDYSAVKLRARLDAPGSTVLDRMLAAGISEVRARQHIAAGAVRVDQEPVTSADQLAEPPARIVIYPR